MPPVRHLLVVSIALILAGLAFQFARPGAIGQVGTWFSVLPVLTAIALAMITHRLLPSLLIALVFSGILVNIFIAKDWLAVATYPFTSIGAVVLDWWSIKVVLFVTLILMTIALIIVGGGLKGVAIVLERYSKGRQSSQFVTAIMGLIVFIDDYANTMIVGSSMRPVTDRYRISRERLAFIVDATSAPVAGLAVVSTWIAFEVGLFEKVSESLSMGTDGYSMFFDAMQYRYYCFFMLLFVFITIITRRDFGPMAQAEQRAMTHHQLIAPDAQVMTSPSFELVEADDSVAPRASMATIPLVGLLLVFISGLWISGGGLAQLDADPGALFRLAIWKEVMGEADNSSVLLLSTLFSFFSALYLVMVKAGLPLTTVKSALKTGLKGSLLPVSILFLAWALKNSFDDLYLGQFLIASFGETLSPLWYPIIVFIIAAIVSFGTGTSWGTMSLLIPISVPLAFSLDQGAYGLITILTLAAVLDGAIFGDHCSPVSDTTIMSSIACASDHLHHVRTQLPYALTVAAVAVACGYLLSALSMSYWLGWLIGSLFFLFLLKILGRRAD